MLAPDLDLHLLWDLESSTVNQPWWRPWGLDGQNSHSLRETTRSGFYRLQFPFFVLNHLRFTTMDHFFGSLHFTKGPSAKQKLVINSVICLFWPDFINEFGHTPNSKGQMPLANPWFCNLCLALWPLWSSRLDMVLKSPANFWLLSAPDFTLNWELSRTSTSIQFGGPAANLFQGEEPPFFPFPGPWMLIQILWMSEFCLSLEFLISSSSFSDLVLISFYTAVSLENVCSIQASAYRLLLNTHVNIHWISMALFSFSCNKLSHLLLEATVSPYWNSRLCMCMQNPSEFIFISSATSPWLFL